jgi:hypothetical protein
MNIKQRSWDVGGGAQRPVLFVNELKKTGARSARARTRGQNPLVGHVRCRREKLFQLCRPSHLFSEALRAKH